ncbi:MAG: type III secretion system gatekeeper subunit SctW [Kiritimatiellae bacterium]|nr:type III secretion system gatekeeper subunit SctW [Kiritimatiellia bacterium]
MAFDAAQILRQTYAAGAEAAQMAQSLQREQPAAAQVERGSINGTACVVEADPMAELMDSMEELSFQFEEKTAKRLGERKMGPLQGMRASFIRALEAWQAMMPDMPGNDQLKQAVQNARQMLRSGMSGGGAEGLLRMLGGQSTDPSHQFAMLDLMEQMLAEGETELRDLIRDARALLMAEKGPEVKAGINLAQEVNARAATPDEMQGLRDLYRSEVVGFEKPQDCFRSLLASRGPGGLKDAIDFLIAGCGADLKSGVPSLEAAALGRILTDLGCVQSLQAMLDKLTQLGDRMGKQFGEPCFLNGEQLAGRVVDLTEQAFVAATAIAHLVGDCGMRQLLAQMDFTRELTRLFRMLSPRLFQKEGDRQRLVDAAQEHLDGLIMEEEAQAEEEATA